MATGNNSPIGVFDSGLGGISVLVELCKLMPEESFIYYGDSAHAPYGVKKPEEVKRLVNESVTFLLKKDIKALVVACNTITSVAIHDLREKLSIPVVGMEPAVKPAIELGKLGKILVLATPMTLRMEKFHHLLETLHDREQIIPIPCPGLVELIEEGDLEGPRILAYLKKLLENVDVNNVYAVVLGCTHYPFIRKEIAKRFTPGTAIIDGNLGTARQLQRVLSEHSLLAKDAIVKKPRVLEFYSSSGERMIELYKKMFEIACRF